MIVKKACGFCSLSLQCVLQSIDKKEKHCWVSLLNLSPHIIETCCLIPQCKIAVMSNFRGRCGWLNGLPKLIVIPKFSPVGRTWFSSSYFVNHQLRCYIKWHPAVLMWTMYPAEFFVLRNFCFSLRNKSTNFLLAPPTFCYMF